MTRRGMTLVEMLVAMTATLLLMAAVAQAFAVFGSAITGSRGVLDLDARMRSAAWRLRSDLAGITVRPLPPITPESAQGYLEIIEGPLSDRQNATSGGAIGNGSNLGPTDVDDVLLFTAQSTNRPFIGRVPNGRTFESTVAEVAWFARRTPTPNPSADNPPTYTLYRRQLLVMGYVGVAPFSNGDSNSVDWASAGSSWSTFYNAPCDVSVRREGSTLVPNTLSDLSRREARFLHNLFGNTIGTAFPYLFCSEDLDNDGTLDPGEDLNSDGLLTASHQSPIGIPGLIFDSNSARQGEDVVLADIIAFDVRVFDPGAPVTIPGGTPLAPGDPGYTGAPVASGAYVDLGHGAGTNALLPVGITPRFAGTGQTVGGSATLPRTYDTWSLAYEANGRDEDGQHGTDQSINGLDDNGDGIIDDPGEFETRPPYPYPLRGIEVRIRCYEPSSRQVRQVTIRHTFVPH
jgi:prepilin-type N-terminal cleavage/methylation domain-containing protein